MQSTSEAVDEEKESISSSVQGPDNGRHFLSRVISGGQTGADRAALEAATDLRIPTGGWAPPRFMTSAGPDSSLKLFGLREVPVTRSWSIGVAYVKRSKMNVDDSDGTIVFRYYSSPGTDRTIGYCATGQWSPITRESDAYRPCLVISSLGNGPGDRAWTESILLVRKFIIDNGIRVLNVAGHRQSDTKESIKQFLKQALHDFSQALASDEIG